MTLIEVNFVLNHKKMSAHVDPQKTLLHFLRDDLHLTGTKAGCEVGECGACTVIMNNKAVNSCLVYCGQINNSEILTIEGLGKDDDLDDIQKSFIEHHAVQCGFCTPGMIMSAKALLMNNPHPTTDEIKEAISGNLCRCTGYDNIIKAIKNVNKHTE